MWRGVGVGVKGGGRGFAVSVAGENFTVPNEDFLQHFQPSGQNFRKICAFVTKTSSKKKINFLFLDEFGGKSSILKEKNAKMLFLWSFTHLFLAFLCFFVVFFDAFGEFRDAENFKFWDIFGDFGLIFGRKKFEKF